MIFNLYKYVSFFKGNATEHFVLICNYNFRLGLYCNVVSTNVL